MSSIPKYSRAAVLREFKAPLQIEEVEIPLEIEPGAILVRVETCSICGTDVHLSRGALALKVDLPVIVGHEMVGRIVVFGPGSRRDSIGQDLREGDRITWTHTSCGSCFFCTVAREPTLCENSRKYMYECMEVFPHLLGGFAEYSYVMPDSGRVRVPENVPNDLASMASCAFRSVMNAFDLLGRINPTDVVVIQGVGPLGLLATAVAKISGARHVVAIGGPDSRLELAGKFGADKTLSIERVSHEGRMAAVQDMTSGRGADVVMEFTGNPSAFAEGLDLARRGASYVVVGQLGQGTVSVKPSILVGKNLRVLGSFSGQARAYWKALDFISRHIGDIPFALMISNRYKLEGINAALERMARFEEIKPIIDIW